MTKESMDILNIIFEAVQALGTLATFGAFVFLFRKDKEKQEQINSLASIANHLEAQSSLMKRSNELLSLQVDILNKESQGKMEKSEVNSKMAALEAKKMRLAAMPRLFTNGGMSRGYEGEIQLNLSNKGERAILKEFAVEGDLVLHNEHLPYDLEKDAERKIFLRSPDMSKTNSAQYKITVTYEDGLGYKYQSIIEGQGAKCKLTGTQEI